MSDFITIKYRDSNLMSGSGDVFRTLLGGYYEISGTQDGYPTLHFQYGRAPSVGGDHPGWRLAADPGPLYGDPQAIEDEVYGIANVYRGLSDTIDMMSEKSILPYMSTPWSIQGDQEKFLNSDEWNKFVLGGTFGANSYPGVYTPGVFDVQNIDLSTTYDMLYVKLIDPELGTTGPYNTHAHSCVYHRYSPQYEEVAKGMEFKQLPNCYFLADAIYQGPTSMDPRLALYVTLSGTFDVSEDADDDTSGVQPLFTEPTTNYYPALSAPPEATTNPVGDIDSDGVLYGDRYESSRRYFYEFSQASTQIVEAIGYLNANGSNLIFNKSAATTLFPQVNDTVAGIESYMPYYNKIDLPFNMDQGSNVGDVYALSDVFNDNGSMDLLLKEIKDRFVYNRAALSAVEYTQERTFKDLNASGNIATVTSLNNNTYSYMNVLEFLRNYANRGTPRIPLGGEPCIYMGSETLQTRAAQDSNGYLRYVNKIAADKTIDDLKTTILARGQYGTPLLPTDSDDALNPLPFFARACVEDHAPSLYEPIAFRIEKTEISTKATQNIIIEKVPRSDVVDTLWHYCDTQVRYGETYQYNVYAYYMTVGYRYRYRDLTISRAVGETVTPGTFIGGAADYVCGEFYDGNTNQIKSSPMNANGESFGKAGSTEETERAMLRSPLSVINENGYITPAQEIFHPTATMWADFRVDIEPTLRLVEFPLNTKTLTVSDNPPPKIDVTPYQIKDDSQTIGFYLKLENFSRGSDLYPTPITEAEMVQKATYLESNNLLPEDMLDKETVSRPRYVEVYRLANKPTAMTDFREARVELIDLAADKRAKSSYSMDGELEEPQQYNEKTYISPACFHEERISTNHKFYYAFRFLNEHKMPGPWAPIQIVELINDGGYKYCKFDTILENNLTTKPNYDEPFRQFKKLIKLVPNIQHLTLNDAEVNYEGTAKSQVDKLEIGSASTPLWGKIFKVRLTSKKTGKKIDLNITYKVGSET